jgi:hypothetical protein
VAPVDVLRGVIVGLAMAELLFVATFTLSEGINLAIRTWTMRIDRRMQALPEESYAVWFAIPMITAGSGVGIAVGVNFVTGDYEPGQYVGAVMILGSLLLFGYTLLGFASGSLPRTTFRPRVRQQLAQLKKRLESDAPVGRAEAARLRGRLRRLERTGDRLSDRAAAAGWRAAVRDERPWLVWAVVAAIVLPITGVIAAVVTRRGDVFTAEQLRPLGVLLALSMAAAAGAVMRRIRLRWELQELGEELRTGSAALLEQLAELTEPDPVPNKPSLPSRLLSWLGFRRRSG